MEQDIELLKYPVGKFERPATIDSEQLEEWTAILETFPVRIAAEVSGLSEDALEQRYRPGGWTIRQVVNHCADSHLNSFMRFKLALTEDLPTIKPYFEDRWAELYDSKILSPESALKMLEGIHERWVALIRHLNAEDLECAFHHPESGQKIDLKTTVGIYAWHCRHHLAHVQQAKRSAR